MFTKKEEQHAKPEEVKQKQKAPVEAPVQSAKAKKPLEEKKAVKDIANEAYFAVGDVVKVKDLDFVVHEVKAIDLILKRKDFK